MKKRLLIIPLIALMSLTSCENKYVEGKFFDKKVLKEADVIDLPVPEGTFLRCYSKFGTSTREVLVSSPNGNESKAYAQLVYGYLISRSYKYLYGVSAKPIVHNWKLKEANSFEDHILTGTLSNGYYFFFSNNDFYEKESSDNYYFIDGTGIYISSFGGTREYNNDKKSFKYDYNIRIELNGSHTFSIPKNPQSSSTYE